MIYPHELEAKLGFDHLRAALTNHCLGKPGERETASIRFEANLAVIQQLLNRAEACVAIFQQGLEFPLTAYFDLTVYFESIRIEGSFLEEENFQEVIQTLQVISTAKTFLTKHKEEYPSLFELTGLVQLPASLTSLLQDKFNDQGKIKDQASAELAQVRKRLRHEQERVRKLTDHLFRESVSQGWVPEGATLTVRDGRVVIPVAAEHKRKLKGFIADESSTGQTVFIEPAESLEANNEIRDLLHEERREVIKILKNLTDSLRKNLNELEWGCHFLGTLDLNRAKAKLALELEAIKPQLIERPALSWINAYHPLLYLTLKGKREVVPLTADLQDESRFLLISGPNAGGKSVCLKTIGLVQYMMQCGLLVPMYEQSVMGVFDSIFLDIGDQQSIDNDLSTYSSHLNNMNFFLSHANGSSLVLMDELGSGTDPNFGGGIAEAILTTLLQKKVWGVATTHYYNLKLFASNRTDIRNAAMQFDTTLLKPLFMLEIGKPGSSFALEIAKKTGLPQATLQRAEEIIGKELAGLETLMKNLAEEKQKTERRHREVLEKERQLNNETERYRKLNHELEARKKEIVNRAKEEAATLLKETNREIEKTIRHIRENKAEKKETRKVRHGLEQLAYKVKPVEQQQVVAEKVKEGDKVRLMGQEVTGRLVSIKGGQAVVEFGTVRTTVKLNQLVRSDLAEPASVSKARSLGVDVMTKQLSFSSTLDVRGKRAEDVVPELERFLDDAILLSQHELKILHGKGEGVLRKVIRDYLKRVKEVASFADERIERGGDGITVVILK
ncbi:MAG: Recombination inhibitory protein MutS2 [Cytophagales bacterium]|jgi:DNA mismatch repair protein MutS2|nr:Smr/MutS family protein [Bacteroidota bacterium]MBS1981296.1 Smr/MutS family protein [Bacteroidota bacterium]WHZ09315.1 MAG: Recombination inhibitory protein MutS2 [Cytophagales bacterium]